MDVNLLVAVQDQAPDFWGFVGAGYGLATVVIGGFVAVLVRRGRKLSRQVPPEKRRWL